MTEFQQAMAAQYRDRLATFYRNRTPDLVSHLTDLELSQHIELALKKARSWNLRDAEGITHFVLLSIAAGSSFDETQEFRRLMSVPEAQQEGKIRRLTELVLMELEEVRRNPATVGDRRGTQTNE